MQERSGRPGLATELVLGTEEHLLPTAARRLASPARPRGQLPRRGALARGPSPESSKALGTPAPPPQVGNCSGSGASPDRHCQPPALGTSSTSLSRAGPWLLSPAPSVPWTLRGHPTRPPSPSPSAPTQVTGQAGRRSLGKAGCCLMPPPALLPHSAHRYPTPGQLVSSPHAGGERGQPLVS